MRKEPLPPPGTKRILTECRRVAASGRLLAVSLRATCHRCAATRESRTCVRAKSRRCFPSLEDFRPHVVVLGNRLLGLSPANWLHPPNPRLYSFHRPRARIALPRLSGVVGFSRPPSLPRLPVIPLLPIACPENAPRLCATVRIMATCQEFPETTKRKPLPKIADSTWLTADRTDQRG